MSEETKVEETVETDIVEAMEEIYTELKSHIVDLKFKKLHDDAILPTYAKDGDAGMDCFAVGEIKITEQYAAYDLGFAVEIPYGFVGYLFPRSSISKYDMMLANSVGVIDSGYRGPVQARFKKAVGHENELITYEIGDRICQLIVMPVPLVETRWVDELSDSDRGEGCFGSSGK